MAQQTRVAARFLADFKRPAGESHLWLLFSTDNGQSWPKSKSFPVKNGGIATEEEAMLWLSGDTLIGFARSADVQNNVNSPIGFPYTNDLGTTWRISTTNVAFTPNPGIPTFKYDLVSPVMLPSPMPDGTFVCLFAERQQDVNFIANSQYYIRAIALKPQDAISDPMSFSPTQYLYSYSFHSGLSSFGYPAVAGLGKNKWLFEFFDRPTPASWRLFTFTPQQKGGMGVDL